VPKILRSNRTLVIATGLFIVPIVLWDFLDRRLWAWDQAMYGEASIRLFQNLIHFNLITWANELVHSTPGYAPLSVWVSEFFSGLTCFGFGNNFSLLMATIFFSILTCLLAIKILQGFGISQKRAVIFIPIFFSSIIIQGVSRANYVENSQLLVTFFVLYIAQRISATQASRVFRFLLFLDLLCLLALSKVSAPFEIWPFMGYIFFDIFRGSKRIYRVRKRVAICFFPLSLLLLTLTFLWYEQNFQALVIHLKITKMTMWQVQGSFYSHIVYWFNTLYRDSCLILILCFLLGIFSIGRIGIKIWTRKTPFAKIDKNDKKMIFSILLGLSIANSFLLLFLENNSDPRYLFINIGLVDLYLALVISQKNFYFLIGIGLISSIFVLTSTIFSLDSKRTMVGDHFFAAYKDIDQESAITDTLKRVCGSLSTRNSIYVMYDSAELNTDTWNYWRAYLQAKNLISSSCAIYGNVQIGNPDSSKDSIARILRTHPAYLITTSLKNIHDIFETKKIQDPQITTLPYNNTVPLTLNFLLNHHMLTDLGIVYTSRTAIKPTDYWELYSVNLEGKI